MKKIYKKNIYMFIIAIITVFFGCSNVKANANWYCSSPLSHSCYYINDIEGEELKIDLKLYEGATSDLCVTEAYIDFYGGIRAGHDDEDVLNFWKDADGMAALYKNSDEAREAIKNKECPKYLVFRDTGTYDLYAANDKDEAMKIMEKIKKIGHKAFYASNFNSSGEQYTKDEYYFSLVPKYDPGKNIDVDCSSLFDDKDPTNPDSMSLRELCNEILVYPRIGVPILVIILGIVDFAKAVIASKEEDMKKAQKQFVKRLIIGLAVFFVPTLVNLVMDLTNYIWNPEYINCKL